MFDILGSLEISSHEHDRLLVQQARCLIAEVYPVYDSDETGLYLEFDELYMDIEFDSETPTIVFSANRALNRAISDRDWRTINKLNLEDALGQHALDEDLQHYLYRQSLWLQDDLTSEVLEYFIFRGLHEASCGYEKLVTKRHRRLRPDSVLPADHLLNRSED